MRLSLLTAALAGGALARPAVDAADALTEAQRAQAVIDAFNHAWTGYYQYCNGHDELLPVTNTCGDSRYVLSQHAAGARG